MTGRRSSEFAARVTKDSLVFSAAHFITFNGNVCERLHGHNWRVDVAVEGGLDENGYVFDFIALRDAAMSLVQMLDHRMLLPSNHSTILVTKHAAERSVEVTFENRRWVFPEEDCILLPVTNTTAELLAHWFAERLTEALNLKSVRTVSGLNVRIEENFGQWAEYRADLSD